MSDQVLLRCWYICDPTGPSCTTLPLNADDTAATTIDRFLRILQKKPNVTNLYGVEGYVRTATNKNKMLHLCAMMAVRDNAFFSVPLETPIYRFFRNPKVSGDTPEGMPITATCVVINANTLKAHNAKWSPESSGDPNSPITLPPGLKPAIEAHHAAFRPGSKLVISSPAGSRSNSPKRASTATRPSAASPNASVSASPANASLNASVSASPPGSTADKKAPSATGASPPAASPAKKGLLRARAQTAALVRPGGAKFPPRPMFGAKAPAVAEGTKSAEAPKPAAQAASISSSPVASPLITQGVEGIALVTYSCNPVTEENSTTTTQMDQVQCLVRYYRGCSVLSVISGALDKLRVELSELYITRLQLPPGPDTVTKVASLLERALPKNARSFLLCAMNPETGCIDSFSPEDRMVVYDYARVAEAAAATAGKTPSADGLDTSAAVKMQLVNLGSSYIPRRAPSNGVTSPPRGTKGAVVFGDASSYNSPRSMALAAAASPSTSPHRVPQSKLSHPSLNNLPSIDYHHYSRTSDALLSRIQELGKEIAEQTARNARGRQQLAEAKEEVYRWSQPTAYAAKREIERLEPLRQWLEESVQGSKLTTADSEPRE